MALLPRAELLLEAWSCLVGRERNIFKFFAGEFCCALWFWSASCGERRWRSFIWHMLVSCRAADARYM